MIEVGDHVTVGRGATTWVVENINPWGAILLRSGVTGIHRFENSDECMTLFKKGNA